MNLKIYNYDSVFKELMLQLEGCNGEYRDRTDDPLLAKQVLSQLSYSPMRFDSLVLFECKSLKTEYRFNECVGFRFSLERR